MAMKKSVTSIIMHNGKMLILKRSDSVWYHKGVWGGVSGHIEATDKGIDERAIIEIEEETGLKRASIKMIKAGKPFVSDEDGTAFIVHPYLFETNTEKIIIDWEHTEYKWIIPGELKKFNHIPSLIKVLEAVGVI
ncbi:MAG: NUDIX domain-containing protein [Candidatus Aenigmarchaeota archaeon]|nr:NUDIX domain-containing protein [Candidatus Aenigmarchaeota archaeon]